MEMKLGLQARMLQTQKLVMTPQLQQALRFLQMPTLELQQVLKQEILLNPVLEEVDEILDGEEEEAEARREEPEGAAEGAKEDGDAQGEEKQPEIDWDEYFHSPQDYSYRREQEGGRDETYERVLSTTVLLSEHLLSQLRISTDDDEILRIGEFLIGSLDERGFLTLELSEVAESVRAGMEKVKEALELIQTFDPAGVGAADLRECLLLQFRSAGDDQSLAFRVVRDHFDDFVQNRYAEIAKKLKTTAGEIQDASREVGKLNPRPGMLYADEDPRYITPDLVVDRVGDEYVVYLNDQNVPRLRVSRTYEKYITGGNSTDSTTKEYIRSKLNAANQLINTIERRRRTMVKVMKAIVDNQREFLEKGIRFLKPMTLQQVADEIGMHESTVSRVTSSKYVQTPRGVFELKFFFSSSIRSYSGEDVSTKGVKDRVRELIEKEDKARPLSDQKIVDLLKSEGFMIARRTVAKYREQMGLLSARYRKQF